MHKNLFMFGRISKRSSGTGSLDGGAGRGVPLGGNDSRPRGGYDSANDDHDLEVENEDREPFEWEEGDPADRRKDPLRKPGT